MLSLGVATRPLPSPILTRPRYPALQARLRYVVSAAFGIDTRSLAIFRVGLGVILLLDLGLRTRFFGALLTDAGVLPRATLATAPWEPWAWSLHAVSGGGWWQAALFAVAAAAALALLAGWHTRAANVASWFLLVSLHHRNPIVLNAGDQLLRALLFWAMFLPLGAVWSVDARRTGGRAARVYSAASASLLIQVAVVYLMTALFKYSPEWYVQGTALYYAFNIDALATPFGTWLLGFPGLLKGLTFATVALELGGPLLALLSLGGRLRLVIVLAFVGLHLGIAATLHLGLFPVVCLVAWIPFLPSRVWRVPPEDGTIGGSGWATVTVAAVLLLILQWNLHTLPGTGPAPGATSTAIHLLGLRQRWGMFERQTLTSDGWYVAPASLPDGRTVDLLRGGAALAWARPQNIAATYHMDRWRKYLLQLAQPRREAYRAGLLTYLCRQSKSPPDSVALVFMHERTLPPGERPTLEQLPLGAIPCSPDDRDPGASR